MTTDVRAGRPARLSLTVLILTLALSAPAAAAGLRQVPVAALFAGIACGADAAGGRPRPME